MNNTWQHAFTGAPARSSRLVPLVLSVLCVLSVPRSTNAQFQPPDAVVDQSDRPAAVRGVGIEQRLNEQLPLDLIFRDESGQEVKLGAFFKDRPVILALVYYTCPMLCNQELNGLIGTLKTLSFTAGREFDVVAVSFDPKDTTEAALAKKQAYLARYDRDSATGLHFLTGDEKSIEAVTQAVGFNYRFDEETKQYVHASGIMVVTPEGKLSRYFYGIDYSPKDLRLGLVEASNNKIGTAVDQVLLFCFHYDPITGKYGPVIMNIIRAGGVVTFAGLAILIFFMRRRLAGRRLRSADVQAG
jgi:protein SCO1/2